jgi:hypothetical protein
MMEPDKIYYYKGYGIKRELYLSSDKWVLGGRYLKPGSWKKCYVAYQNGRKAFGFLFLTLSEVKKTIDEKLDKAS